VARSGALKPFRFHAATLAAALLYLLAAPAGASAGVDPGGAAVGNPGPGAGAGGSVRTVASSPHVLTVRIRSVRCVPAPRCSLNPH